MYNSSVKSLLLYGAECWSIIQIDVKKLSSFHKTCFDKSVKFIGVNISNKELYLKAKQCCMEIEIKRRKKKGGGVGLACCAKRRRRYHLDCAKMDT